MSAQHLQHQSTPSLVVADLSQTAPTFAEAIAHIQALALQIFDREIAEKQLCYHTRDHIEDVQRRSKRIFQAIYPYLAESEQGNHMEQLLDLCAITHDLIQIFVPQTEPHDTRHREAGVSETATIKQVLEFIHHLHQEYPSHPGSFSEQDTQVIQEAIAATICAYDPTEQAIFQPALSNLQQPIGWVARILALADIGALGMDGIAAYNQEGHLLFLEENPDVQSLIEQRRMAALMSEEPDLGENIRRRLLKRAQFQVDFAKSRLQRLPQELAGFPPATIPILTEEVFRYLTPETIQAIVVTTPTAEDTALEALLSFFQFAC